MMIIIIIIIIGDEKNIDNLLLRIGTYDFTMLAHHTRHSGQSLLVRNLCSR